MNMLPAIPLTLLLLALSNFASAFQQGSKVQDASAFATSRDAVDQELSMLNDFGVGVPGPLQEVMKIMRDVEKLPSCNKMASQALLNSCSALEGPHSDDDQQRGPDLMLDEAKSIYAARLAVCELSGARATVPSACTSFLPTSGTAKKTGIRGFIGRNGPGAATSTYDRYEEVTEQNLGQCLGALESKPQWWTSYSNARQNAVVMCHAMRSEVEKDEQLHLYKVLAGLTEDITGSLSGSKREFQAVRDAFNNLSGNMRQFHVGLYDEQQEKQAEVARYWASMVESVRQTFDSLTKGAESVQDKLTHASAQVDRHHDQVKNAFASVSQQVSDVAIKQREQAAALSTDIAGLSDAAAFVRAIMQQEITNSVLGLTNSLDTANAISLAMQVQIQQHGDGIIAAAQSIAALADRVISLDQRMDEMHQQNGAKHLELQAQANRTMETLELANAHVETWTASMASVLAFLDGNWAESAAHAAMVGTGFVIATLFSFALWSGKSGLPFVSAGAASVGSGLAITFVSMTCRESLLSAYDGISNMPPEVALALSFVLIILTVACFIVVKRNVDREHEKVDERSGSEKNYLPSFEHSTGLQPPRFRLPINDPNYFAKTLARRGQL